MVDLQNSEPTTGTQQEPTQNTEAVVQLAPDATPFKNTTLGKTIRTFYQCMAGVMTVIVPALIASDDFKKLINTYPQWAWILIALPTATAIWTAIQNALDPTVKNY